MEDETCIFSIPSLIVVFAFSSRCVWLQMTELGCSDVAARSSPLTVATCTYLSDGDNMEKWAGAMEKRVGPDQWSLARSTTDESHLSSDLALRWHPGPDGYTQPHQSSIKHKRLENVCLWKRHAEKSEFMNAIYRVRIGRSGYGTRNGTHDETTSVPSLAAHAGASGG